MGRRLVLWAAIAAAISRAQGPATAPQSANIRIPRVAHPLALEQFLDTPAPAGLTAITDFRQHEPADGKPVSRSTEAWLAYDDDNLYAVFRCHEDPGKVRARLSHREDIFSDDTVVLYLDTFHDRKHAYGFYVNPLGVQSDSLVTEGQPEDYSFDTLWQSAGRVTAGGYLVWMAIPFKSLRFRSADVQTWGIGLGRNIPAVNESSYWPYYTARVEGFVQQLGTLEGLEKISPGHNLQFIPYAAAGRARFLDDGRFGPAGFRTNTDLRVGLDSKVILRDALTLDVTVNPDFSQVESDAPQVTVNQRFEVFFPEKRPFFLDNANYFQTPENLFFSRRIQDPEFGARLTGKAGKWIVGLLAIDDRAPGQQLAAGDAHYGEHALAAVGRVQREIAGQSTVGATFTHYRFGGAQETVGGFDTRLKLLPNLVLTAQAVREKSSGEGGASSSGSSYFAELAYSGLHFNAATDYLDRSPRFKSSLGYIPRVDIRQLEQTLEYRWRPAGRVVKSWGPVLRLLGISDHRGLVQDWRISPAVTFEFAGQTNGTIGFTESMERFGGIDFHKHSTDISLGTDFLRYAGIQVTYGAGARVNYDPAGTLPAFLANGKDLNVNLTLRPTSRLKLEETYLLSHLSTIERSWAAVMYGPAAIFNNHLLRSTMNYQFTRALSLRAIADYNGVLPNASLAAIDRVKRVTGDVLLTYLLHPGTAVYLGYTDRRENLGLVPGAPQVARIPGPDTVTARQFFAKISYLLRF